MGFSHYGKSQLKTLKKKNMKKILLLAWVGIGTLYTACTSSNNTSAVKDGAGNEFLVAHYQEIKDTVVMNLSDLVEDYELIRFENNDSALLGFRVMPTITEHYIGFSQDNKQPYLLFDR